MSNNFLIRKRIFQQFQFTNGWKGYGHEDTWMGIQLQLHNSKIKFIDNPVLHDGLENTDSFIAKTKSAVENLYLLSGRVPKNLLLHHVRLYRYFHFCSKFGLLKVITWVNRGFHSFIKKNLHACAPSLILFDLFRLNYFIQIHRSRNKNNDEKKKFDRTQSIDS